MLGEQCELQGLKYRETDCFFRTEKLIDGKSKRVVTIDNGDEGFLGARVESVCFKLKVASYLCYSDSKWCCYPERCY